MVSCSNLHAEENGPIRAAIWLFFCFNQGVCTRACVCSRNNAEGSKYQKSDLKPLLAVCTCNSVLDHVTWGFVKVSCKQFLGKVITKHRNSPAGALGCPSLPAGT